MSEIFINGPMGRLEGRFEPAENPKAPVALVLSPNPLHGGTMNNRITYTLFQAFRNLGFSVLRFNFRGVGGSQGEQDGTGAGELIDTITVLDWLQSLPYDFGPTWIAGYEFGAWVAAQVLMRRPELKGFVFASPPLHLHNFDFLSPCPASGLIIHPEKDIYNTEAAITHLAEQLDEYQYISVKACIIPGADYQYTNKLKPLYDAILGEVPTLKLNNLHKSSKKKVILSDY